MYKTLSPSRTGDRPNPVIAKPIARRNHKVFPCPCWWFPDFKNFPGQGMTLHCSQSSLQWDQPWKSFLVFVQVFLAHFRVTFGPGEVRKSSVPEVQVRVMNPLLSNYVPGTGYPESGFCG